MKSFQLKIITPKEVYLTKIITSINLNLGKGFATILAEHISLISSIRISKVIIKDEKDRDTILVVSSGVFQMINNECKIIVEDAFLKSDLNKKDLESKIKESKGKLSLLNSEIRKEELIKKISLYEECLKITNNL